MPRYPAAVWEPENSHGGPLTPTTIIVHSNAGHSQDPGGYMDGEGLSSHFQVASDGTVYQYVDTGFVAFANVEANGFAISIETENSVGYPDNPTFDTDTWAGPQRSALLALLDWCCTTHGIPRTVVTEEAGGGLGWHEQFPQWTTTGHHCPGNARVQQLHADIIPALNPKKGPFMALTDKQQADLYARVVGMTSDDGTNKYKPGVLARLDARTWQFRGILDAIVVAVKAKVAK